ncbi:MAG: hypothetical protein WCF16_10160, partial [Alphaproteobacteria bacterium]
PPEIRLSKEEIAETEHLRREMGTLEDVGGAPEPQTPAPSEPSEARPAGHETQVVEVPNVQAVKTEAAPQPQATPAETPLKPIIELRGEVLDKTLKSMFETYRGDWARIVKAHKDGKLSDAEFANLRTLRAQLGRVLSAEAQYIRDNAVSSGPMANDFQIAYLKEHPAFGEQISDGVLEMLTDMAANNPTVAVMLEDWKAGRFKFELDPTLPGLGRHITGTDVVRVNPFFRDSKITNGRAQLRTLDDIAATMLHEYMHFRGYGELRAWYEQLNFLRQRGRVGASKYEMAHAFGARADADRVSAIQGLLQNLRERYKDRYPPEVLDQWVNWRANEFDPLRPLEMLQPGPVAGAEVRPAGEPPGAQARLEDPGAGNGPADSPEAGGGAPSYDPLERTPSEAYRPPPQTVRRIDVRGDKGILPDFAEPGAWTAPDNRTFTLEGIAGGDKGKYAEVFALVGGGYDGYVIKIYDKKEYDVIGQNYVNGNPVPEKASMSDAVADIVHGAEVLEKHGILHLRVTEAVMADAAPYVIQERLRDGDVVLGPSGALTPGQQQAVIELFDHLAREGVIWDDSHGGNIFVRPRPGATDQWEAGILDTDRIVEWGQVPSKRLASFLTLVRVNPAGRTKQINSLEGTKVWNPRDAREFMAKMFEMGHRWLSYDEEKQTFVPGRLDPKQVEEEGHFVLEGPPKQHGSLDPRILDFGPRRALARSVPHPSGGALLGLAMAA